MMSRFITLFFLSILICGSAFGASPGSKKIKVTKVIFEGNSTFSNDRLEKLMLTRPSKFLAASYYYPELLSDDLDNLSIFYQQNGYLEAKIVNYNVDIDTLKAHCTITIKIDEGPITLVGGVSVLGNIAFNDSTILQQVRLIKDEPFRRNLIQDDQLAILSLYADSGYLEAVIKPDIKINREVHTGFVDYLISENSCFSVGNIFIKGNEKTKRRVILRELLLKSGETIKYSKLLSTQRQLYSTDLFESVFLNVQPNIDSLPNLKDILIELKEKESSEFNFLLGYGSEDKVRTRLEFITKNLAGTARKAGVGLKASFIRRAVDASFTDPRFFGMRWRFDINSMFEFYEQPGYDVSRLTNLISIGRPLWKKAYLKTSFRYEDARLRHIVVTENIETLDPKVRSIMLTLSHDSRDNLFDPRKGVYLEWSNEFAGAFLKGNNTFSRSVIRLKSFFDLNNKTILASALEIGLIHHIGAYDEIPLSERFYTGGTNSLRGFKYQKVGPLDANNNPLGGKFMIVWNLFEIRRSLYKTLGAVMFVDIGNVWNNINQFSLSDMRISAGPGLRLGTPIGILRLDYGVNLDKRKDEPLGLIHFNMGHTF